MYLGESGSDLAESWRRREYLQSDHSRGSTRLQRLGHMAYLENNKKCKGEGQQKMIEDE